MPHTTLDAIHIGAFVETIFFFGWHEETPFCGTTFYEMCDRTTLLIDADATPSGERQRRACSAVPTLLAAPFATIIVWFKRATPCRYRWCE